MKNKIETGLQDTKLKRNLLKPGVRKNNFALYVMLVPLLVTI